MSKNYMYDEVMAAFVADPNTADSDLPKPVRETASIVRLPAFQDDHALWQGATVIQDSESRYILRLDDGRVSMHSTPAEAWAFYASNADCWM